MSVSFYVILHLIGVMLLFFSLGGMTLNALNGAEEPSKKAKVILMSLHGVALLLLLVAGVGILHKSGWGWPPWAFGKIGLWVLLGAAPALLKRKPLLARPLLFVLPALGAIAAWLAVFKPGMGS